MYIAIDFDGTVVSHEFPNIGQDIGAEIVLKALVEKGHNLLLNTMRCEDKLDAAVEWFNVRGIPLSGINENPSQKTWTSSPKVHAHIYIDDCALGIPLVHGVTNRPFVDWKEVALLLRLRGVL